MKKTEAALDDSAEERDKENYIVKKHFLFHHNGIISSYVMRGVGFGIEFCNNMDLYEINYGMQMQREEKRKLTVIQQYLNTVLSLVAIVVKPLPCSHGMKKNSITGSVTC